MKKASLITLILGILLLIVPLKSSKAEGFKPFATFVIKSGSQNFTVDNLPKSFSPKEVYPTIINGSMFIPLREVIDEAGGNISWNGKEKRVSISINDIKIDFTISAEIYSVNGQNVNFSDKGSLKPIIISGKTLVPLDFLTKNLGETSKNTSIGEISFNIYKQLIQTADATGRKFSVPKKINKIISLYPMSTQLLFPLHAQNALIASPKGMVVNFDNFSKVFPKASTLTDASDFRNPNVETILSLNPDLVITTYTTPIKKLEDVGIPVALLNQETPQGMLKSIQFLGNILGKTEEARQSLIYFNEKLSFINNSTIGINNKMSVYFAGANILQTFGKYFFQNSLVRLAGAVSVSNDMVGGEVTVSTEQILAWQPDFIVLAPYCKDSVQDVLTNTNLKDLKAVKNKKVIMMPSFILSYDLPTPESILGIMWLSNQLYPKFVDFNIAQEARDFYQRIYSYKLTDADVKSILGN
jgi:iron complex transport system substrate-binding protein